MNSHSTRRAFLGLCTACAGVFSGCSNSSSRTELGTIYGRPSGDVRWPPSTSELQKYTLVQIGNSDNTRLVAESETNDLEEEHASQLLWAKSLRDTWEDHWENNDLSELIDQMESLLEVKNSVKKKTSESDILDTLSEYSNVSKEYRETLTSLRTKLETDSESFDVLQMVAQLLAEATNIDDVASSVEKFVNKIEEAPSILKEGVEMMTWETNSNDRAPPFNDILNVLPSLSTKPASQNWESIGYHVFPPEYYTEFYLKDDGFRLGNGINNTPGGMFLAPYTLFRGLRDISNFFYDMRDIAENISNDVQEVTFYTGTKVSLVMDLVALIAEAIAKGTGRLSTDAYSVVQEFGKYYYKSYRTAADVLEEDKAIGLNSGF